MKAISLSLFCVVFTMIARASVGPFESVQLAWDRDESHGTNISYVLKWGTVSNAYPNAIDYGTNTTALLTNLTSGFLYFIVVARTLDGLESAPSNLLIITNYPAAPLRLRMTTNTLQSVRLEGTRNGGMDWQHLATVTSDPAMIMGSMRSMMIRASAIVPPLP